MTSVSSDNHVTFSPSTRAAFSNYLRENPNSRRVSRDDKEAIVEWLLNPSKRPSSQQEFSRRNYVRKTFAWDDNSQTLVAKGKNEEGNNRMVVTDDMIADVVEFVHENNNHAGWDATWKAVGTAYYGILRSDLVFLLKRCQTCAQNPSKRPKGSANTAIAMEPGTRGVFALPDPENTDIHQPAWEPSNDEAGDCHPFVEAILGSHE